jgi:hypothetical protein
MKYITFLMVFCAFQLNAQVKGVVFGQENGKPKEPIAYAQIKVLNQSSFFTDENGTFEYVVSKNSPDTLIVSYGGFVSDTLILTKQDRFAGYEIILIPEKELESIKITARAKSHGISRMNALQVEELGRGELRKAACCNLSESFETNASVDVNMTDAVTGTKKIQLLGLDGQYTQIQFENIPALRGLEAPLGLNSVPGTWVNSIQITKGTGTVVNGYESMAGLINVEFLKKHDLPPLFVNVYGNIFGRFEANIQSGFELGKRHRWNTGLFAHYSENFMEMDQNKDGFRDMPIGRLLSFMNKWNYSGDKLEFQLTARAFQENKLSGQIGAFERNFDTKYGTALNQSGIEFSTKTGFLFKQIYRSLGVILNYKYHDLDFKLSGTNFRGFQNRIYGNVIYDDIFGSTIHKYRTGISFVYDDFSQNLLQRGNPLTDNRHDIVPGVFFEYTYTSTRFTGVAGLRYDYHNRFKDMLSPRFHGKVIVTEKSDLRFTVGRGWRTPNYIVDNLSLLASSRNWVANQQLKPEISWNAGVSFVQRFKLFNRSASFLADYYYTFFERQLVVDRDVASNLVVFNNLKNNSYSHAVQVEFEMEPARNFVMRFAYKFLDIKAKYGDKMQQQVLVPQHRGMINLSYKTRNKRWEFDLTGKIYGNSRLPTYEDNGSEIIDKWTPIYPMINSQVTHIYKNWDFYVGVENMTNFKQKNPIVDAQNPFGSTFDATQVWGSIMGINVYAGIRFTLKHKENENKKNEHEGHDH